MIRRKLNCMGCCSCFSPVKTTLVLRPFPSAWTVAWHHSTVNFRAWTVNRCLRSSPSSERVIYIRNKKVSLKTSLQAKLNCIQFLCSSSLELCASCTILKVLNCMVTIPLDRRRARSYLSWLFQETVTSCFPFGENKKTFFPLELSLGEFHRRLGSVFFSWRKTYHHGHSMFLTVTWEGFVFICMGIKLYQMIPTGSFSFSIWEGLKELPRLWRDFWNLVSETGVKLLRQIHRL